MIFRVVKERVLFRPEILVETKVSRWLRKMFPNYPSRYVWKGFYAWGRTSNIKKMYAFASREIAINWLYKSVGFEERALCSVFVDASE